MCQFKYTHHSCGHTLPKFEEPNDPSCKLCVPVLVALKYYHDQPTQVYIENSFQQPPIRMPKPYRPMGPESLRDAEDTAHTHACYIYLRYKSPPFEGKLLDCRGRGGVPQLVSQVTSFLCTYQAHIFRRSTS